MDRSPLNRRDFHKLSSAALGGLLAGGMLGCDSSSPPPGKTGNTDGASKGGDNIDLAAAEVNFQVGEKHVCRGLNACKGLDREGDNECAGQGDCATFEAICGGSNGCKGLGGCGESPGFNECAGQGGCHIPLMKGAWSKARSVFEAKMKAEGKKFGEAPAPSKKKAPPADEPAEKAEPEVEEGAEEAEADQQ